MKNKGKLLNGKNSHSTVYTTCVYVTCMKVLSIVIWLQLSSGNNVYCNTLNDFNATLWLLSFTCYGSMLTVYASPWKPCDRLALGQIRK